MRPFVIYALPRSRTFWLSRFLSYGGWACGHEEIRHLRSLEDVSAWFSQGTVGTVETGAAPWWRLLQAMRPDVQTVVIRRPVDEVVDSLIRTGLPFDILRLSGAMRRLNGKLDQIERRVPNVLSIGFRELEGESACAALFEHCLPYRHDSARWHALSGVNLQVDLAALFRYQRAHESQLVKLAKATKFRVIAGLARRPIADAEGLTIQQETFETFFRDGQRLFGEHLIQVGEAPDAFLGKNLSFMRLLDQVGCMQITTARSNGRMFGYLMAIISPSLESPDVISALHTTFFADGTFPGLGMRLQRASIAALRERGVGEVFMRAGVRGSGPKMGALYQRLGATDYGRMFALSLAEG